MFMEFSRCSVDAQDYSGMELPLHEPQLRAYLFITQIIVTCAPEVKVGVKLGEEVKIRVLDLMVPVEMNGG